jgi:AbrB family looped-hinge helix DNA binding protein
VGTAIKKRMISNTRRKSPNPTPGQLKILKGGSNSCILTSKLSKIVRTSMAAFATAKLSSKGQIVIPEEVRINMGLKEGTQFVVIGEGDTVILRMITPPSQEEMRHLLAESKAYAKKVGLKKADVGKAIKKARRGK